MGVVAGLVGAAAATSLGTTAYGMLSGDSGSSAPANQSYGGQPNYVPTNQPGADQQYQGIYNQLNSYATALPGQTIPGYQAYTSNIQNNPYAAGAQAGAGQVAQAGQQAAGQQISGGTNLYGAGNQILSTAFDPQHALYDYSRNQASQQAAVSNAQAGVTGPYAAGVTNQALQNFDMNWQNQQLQRQQTGELAANQAYAGASNLSNAGLSTYGTSSAAPYNTYLSQQQNDIGALSSLSSGTSGAFAPAQMEQNMLQSYLGLGQSASNIAQAGQQAGFNQNQKLGSQFGQSLSALGGPLSNLFSNSSSDNGAAPSNYGQSYSNVNPSTFNYYDPSGDYLAA